MEDKIREGWGKIWGYAVVLFIIWLIYPKG